MKFKFLYFCMGLSLLTFLLISNSGGRATVANDGNTGAPGETGTTCATCHAGGTFGLLTETLVLSEVGTSVPITSYTPGATYDATFTITPSAGTPGGYGFQMTALDAGANANIGTWQNLGANVQMAPASNIAGRIYVEQGGGTSASNVFTMQWVAPAVGSGDATFYYAGNAVDGVGSTANDVGSSGASITIIEGAPPCLETPAYAEDFATFLPNCWEEASTGDPATGPMTPGSGSWAVDGFANAGTTGATKINLYTTGASDWLITPEFDLSVPGPWELVFDIALTEWGNTNPTTMGSDDEIHLLVTIDGGVTWSNLMTWDATSTVSNTGDQIIISLAAYSGTTQFAYWATEGTLDDPEDYDFFVDNFEIRMPPACNDVTGVSATNVLDTQAAINWTAGGTETQWVVEYGPTGFTPGSGTPATVTANPHILTGLMGSTAYDVYVSSDCNPGLGNPIGPFTFVTQCPAVTAPILEDFEAAAGSVPSCWRNFGNGETWEFNTTDGHIGNAGNTGDHTSGTGYMAYVDDSSPHSQTTTLQTPLVDISGLTTPVFSFWLLSDNEGITNVDFSVNIWDGSAWVPNVYTSNTNTGGWLEVIIPLTGYTGPVMATFVVDENNGTDFYDDVAIDDVEFKEVPLCATPSNITITNVTATTADVSWVENGTATMWNVEYGPTGFTPGTGTTVSAATTATSTISGLMEVTTYDVYVTADCVTNGLSAAAGPSSFTTPCASLVPPHLENFATFLPDCWEEASTGDPATGPMTPGSGSWAVDGFANAGTTGATKINLYTTGASDWLITPEFDLSVPGPWELVFDIALTEWGNTNPTTMGSDDEIHLLVTIDGGVTWSNLMTWDATSTVSNTGDQIIISLAAYSGTTQFAYWATEGTLDDLEDYDFFVDNFEIRMPPACNDVTGVSATNVLDTQAAINWTAGGTETQWIVEYGPTGFTPGSGTPATVTTNPHILTGLMGSTAYDVYVSSDCNPGLGNPIGPFTFVTQCAPLAAPYFEDFETAAGSVPTCWRNFGNGETWEFNTTDGHIGNAGNTGDHTSGTGYMAYVDDSSPHSQMTTLQTPLVDVSTLSDPVLCFWLLSDNEGFTNVDFSVNLWDGAAWVPNVYTSSSNTGGWVQITLPLSAYTISGPVMATFVVDENNGTDFYDDVAIDDVAFKEAPACPAPINLTASNITETTADLSWTSTGSSWNIEWGTVGFAKGTGTTVTTAGMPYALTGLTPGTSYDYYVQTDCGGPIADLIITGVGDGPLPGGQPKFVELYAVNEVVDLGIYGLESANNGGGAVMQEYTFPIGVAVPAGTFLYITGDSASFNNFFGFDADYIDGTSTGVNGDDAIVLYENGTIIDVAGDPNMDGTGSPWEYLDGWMYRSSNTNNDGIFVLGDWSFSGINVFDGQTTNATSPTPFPLGTYVPPVSACVGPYTFTTLLGCGGNFTDSEGPTADYLNNAVDSVTICPDNAGDLVSVNFTFFSSENNVAGCYDGLSIYDGDDITDPAINAPTGSGIWCWDRDDATPSGSGDLQGMTITSSDATGCLTFIFTSDGSVTREGWEAMVTCAPPPPCPAPTALTATNITYNSADLGWTSAETEWTVEYDTTGFATGAGTMFNTTSNPHTLTGLMPNTTYDYYLKNYCGGTSTDLIIAGVLGGDSPSDPLKAIVFYAIGNIPDASIYEFGMANNGGGSDGIERTLLPIALNAGDFYYVAPNSAAFTSFFGFAPTQVPTMSIDGNDAIELYESGTLVDLFGDVNDGTFSSPWAYKKGWAYRNSGQNNNGGIFDAANWTFSGNNALVGATTNATATTPFPINSYAPSSGNGISACVGPFTFTTLCAPFVGDSIQNPILIPALPYADTSTTAQCFSNTLGNTSPDAFYQFTTSACVDSVTISLCGSSYDTYLRLFDATGTMIAFNDDACSTQSELMSAVSGGTTYTVAVEGFGANAGDYILNISESFNPPAIALDTVINITCNGAATGEIQITVADGIAPYMFNWSNGATTEDVSGLTAGMYTGTVTDANGCVVASPALAVTEPTAIAIAVDTVINVSCNGAADGSISLTITGGTAPYAYNWSNGASTEDLTGLSSGVYTGTITDANGCTMVGGPATVTEPAVLSLGIDASSNVSCFGGSDGSISITVTGGTAPYAYNWSNGASTEDLSGLAAGTYSGTITDANGCSVVGGPATITEPAELTFGLDALNNVSCNGANDGSVFISTSGGTPPYTYVWSDGTTNEDITGLAPGTYGGTITDANGCMITGGPVPISEPAVIALSAVVTDETFVTLNDGAIDLMVSGGTTPYNFVWDNGATTEDLTGLDEGTYCVTMTDDNGCTEASCWTVAEGMVSSTQDIENLDRFDLFPNPTSSKAELQLEFSKPVDLNVQVVNVLGQVIFEEGNTNVLSQQFNFDLAKYAAGTYFVRLRVDNQIATKQLIVTK